MTPEIVSKLIAENPSLALLRAKLEALEPGTFCLHRSWGIGRIKSYDESADRVIIDFEDAGKMNHAMAPAFCAEKLEILPKDHILVRYHTERPVIEELIKKRKTNLIAEILKGFEDNKASNYDIERILEQLLGATKFKKWWNAVKKELVKDPRIGVPAKATDFYVLREIAITPEEEILEEFYGINTPKKQIQLAERLYQLADSVEAIAQDLPRIYDILTTSIKNATKLSQAEKLHGIWVRNDLCRSLYAKPEIKPNSPEDPVEMLEPSARSIIGENLDTLNELSLELPGAYQSRLLQRLFDFYPERYLDVSIEILRTSQGKLTNECINFLVEHKHDDLVRETLERWLQDQSIKSPILLWIVRNRNSRKFAKIVKNLINPRLLNSILTAIDNEALQSESTRRIQLADLLSEDTELIPDLLAESNVETAQDLAQSLLLNQGFGPLEKKSIFARFIKIYPSVQKLIAGHDDTNAQDVILWVSQSSLDARQKEYDDLIQNQIPANKEAIVIAREHGDLRENSEYKMARQEQETLMARKALLESELTRARVFDFSTANADAVGIGTVVDLMDPGTKEMATFIIMGAWDGDADKNILSYKTPLAQTLSGKKVGDEVVTNVAGHKEEWVIKGIRLAK